METEGQSAVRVLTDRAWLETGQGRREAVGVAQKYFIMWRIVCPFPLAVAAGLALAMMSLLSGQLGMPQGVEALSSRVSG